MICYLLAGVGMAAAFITREDGYWLLPFFIAAAVIGGIFVLADKDLTGRAFRLISAALPAVMTVAVVLTICSINNKYYNVFTLTDFNGGSFADCYGAMTRLSHENWHPPVAVPEDVRQRMYEGCVSFGQFKYYLEESNIKKDMPADGQEIISPALSIGRCAAARTSRAYMKARRKQIGFGKSRPVR